MSRLVILYIAQSLDGFIARLEGSIDWLTKFETNQDGAKIDYGYETFLSTIDVILMGRKTYDQIASFGEFPYKNQECYVFSHYHRDAKAQVKFITTNPVAFVKDLIERKGNNIWVVGGAQIIAELFEHQCIDEIILFIMPILIGEGIALFSPKHKTDLSLKLSQSRIYPNGVVELRYRKILEL